MRRLLEIAAQKTSDDNEICKHYAIMRRFTITNSEEDSGIKEFENVNETLQESFYKDIGVNIIWVNEYNEIPQILKKIKGSYDQF